MSVAWQIGGTAGEGLESGGEAFARALASMGYRPTTQRDFPSRIRGGDTTSTVRLTEAGHLVPPPHIDLGLAFNATILPPMDARMREGSLLLVDEDVEAFVSAHAEVSSFPFRAIAKELGAPRAMNVVALGASAALFGLPIDDVASSVAKQFAGKGDKVAAANDAAVRAGHEAAMERFGQPRFSLPAAGDEPASFLSGNEAAALGAIAAGCRIAAAYPITPASDVLEFLTPRLQSLGGTALQMEDEMAALNVCIGAGFTGARALTATSGPGLSLMTESVGLAASTETPVVILDCQRPGPSTGMPTKHGQEDLWHMMYGGHGEDVRIVLAPSDVEDAFHTTSDAFRLAEAFRCPTFVALDQQMSLFKQTIAPLDLAEAAAKHPERAHGVDAPDAWDGFEPYGGDGEPMRVPLPGEPGGIYYSNSTEHAPTGFTNEDPRVRQATVERRLRRMSLIAEYERAVDVVGDGDVVLVACGSTVGACREAAELLRAKGTPTRVVALRLLWPMPVAAVKQALAGATKIAVADANAFGQLAAHIKMHLPVHDRLVSVRRFDGTPVTAADVMEAV